MPKGKRWGVPRLATHGWVLVLGFLVLGIATLEIRQPAADASASAAATATLQGLRVPLKNSIEERIPGATLDAAQVSSLSAYVVKAGDTIESIAAEAGLTTITLEQVNQLASPALRAGQRILVPPVNGTLVPIDPKQSLDLLAQTFRVDPDVLRKLNGLSPDRKLPAVLFVPAVSTDQMAASASPAPSASDPAANRERVVRFMWPTQGVITQYFWQYHPGLDIANAAGTPEYAADSGKVIWAGWGDYGIYVEIDHGNGFHTIYAHMSQVLVSSGQMVGKGELLGLMGMTGRATGPHLHFEVRYNGVPQNPLDLLP